jgi:O-antigen/teichoic acid export membrane protein
MLSLRKIGSNAASLLTSDVLNRTTTFVLYTLVARYLGAREFGQLSLALALFYMFQVLAVAGLKVHITRQVAKDRTHTGAYLIHGCAAVAASSFCSMCALYGFVHWMRYSSSTSAIILTLSLALFPYALSAVFESIFQGWERMRYIPLVNTSVNVAKIACAVWLLLKGQGLYAVVLTILGSVTAIAGIEGLILLRQFPTRGSRFDVHFCLSLIRSGSTFLGMDGILAVLSSLNIILLSKVASETQVGLYNAASQLMTPLPLVYQNIALSMFPLMCQTVENGFRSLRPLVEGAIEALLVVALPTVAGLFFVGDWVLSVLYKNPAFLQAFPALRIMEWILVSQVFTSILGWALMASHREKINLTIIMVDGLLNLLVGWPLISRFGLTGAALTVLITRTVDLIQHYVFVSRLLSGISLWKVTWKPLAAAICMAAYLAVAPGRVGILTCVSAALIYGAALLALAIWSSGGPREFKLRYLPLMSK